jgi:hypothetical protein
MMRPYPDIVPGYGRRPSAQQLADGPQIPTEVEEHAKSSSRSQPFGSATEGLRASGVHRIRSGDRGGSDQRVE